MCFRGITSILRNAEIDGGPIAFVMQAPLQRRRLVPEVDGAMTLRITTVSGKNQTTIRVEGPLAVEEIENLQKEFQLAAAPVHLDLSGLRSADAEGVRALRSLSAKGAKLVGASIYIHQLLDETPL